jgi:hypothetical protein
MNNVGDAKIFSVPGGAVNGSITYVWSFWDNDVRATREPFVAKKLNVGGAGLPVSCEYSDGFGVSGLLNTTITVNAPPVIVGAPTISVNDALFPFTTTLTSVTYDPEAAGALAYAWYEGASALGAGVTVLLSPGTWQNSLTLAGVSANRTLTQEITDAGAGVTRMDYAVRGSAATGLMGGGAAVGSTITPTASNLPEVIIGPDQRVTFTAYAQDRAAGQLSFAWELKTEDGWAADYSLTDAPVQLANGSYRSQLSRPVYAETPGLKVARCTVTNLATSQTLLIRNPVRLVAAQYPVITHIATDAGLVGGNYQVLRDSYVHFTGTATDANHLLLNYRWDFIQPPGLTLYGRSVMLRPDQHAYYDQSALFAGPLPITGDLTVTDRFGKSATVAIQSFVTVQVWATA